MGAAIRCKVITALNFSSLASASASVSLQPSRQKLSVGSVVANHDPIQGRSGADFDDSSFFVTVPSADSVTVFSCFLTVPSRSTEVFSELEVVRSQPVSEMDTATIANPARILVNLFIIESQPQPDPIGATIRSNQ